MASLHQLPSIWSHRAMCEAPKDLHLRLSHAACGQRAEALGKAIGNCSCSGHVLSQSTCSWMLALLAKIKLQPL